MSVKKRDYTFYVNYLAYNKVRITINKFVSLVFCCIQSYIGVACLCAVH